VYTFQMKTHSDSPITPASMLEVRLSVVNPAPAG